MMKMKGIAVSARSACTSKSLEPSHVLAAIGRSEDEANSAIRFSLGRFTTREEVDHAVAQVVRAVNELGKRHGKASNRVIAGRDRRRT